MSYQNAAVLRSSYSSTTESAYPAGATNGMNGSNRSSTNDNNNSTGNAAAAAAAAGAAAAAAAAVTVAAAAATVVADTPKRESINGNPTDSMEHTVDNSHSVTNAIGNNNNKKDELYDVPVGECHTQYFKRKTKYTKCK